MKENKAMAQETWKISILYRIHTTILPSHKVWEKYNEREVSIEKVVLKHFAIFIGKQLC